MLSCYTKYAAGALAALGLLIAAPASAENIAVGNYGSSANGMPFADDP